jgi:hypothetical protein
MSEMSTVSRYVMSETCNRSVKGKETVSSGITLETLRN